MKPNTVKNELPFEVKSHTFFRELHIYRCFAILLIIAAHSWSLTLFFYTDDFSIDPQLKLLHSVTETLFHDGTIIFALISGLLFSLILKNNSWRKFYVSKVKHVFLPYVLMTFIYTLIQWQVTMVGFYEISPDSWLGYLNAVMLNIPLGMGSFHLWYIPILLLLFVATPAINQLVEKKSFVVLGIIALAPVIASRVWPQFSWLTFVYFLGAYSIGIYAGANYQRSLDFIQRHTLFLLMIFLITSGFLIFFYQINFEKIAFVSVIESVFYLQKLALAGVLLNCIYKIEKCVPPWLDKIGNYSFSIYFIHPLLGILFVEWLKEQGMLSNNPWIVVLLGTVVFLYCLLASMLITTIVKKACGKYSRMVVGA